MKQPTELISALFDGGSEAVVLFEPRDLWVGLFWDKRADGLYFYLCLVPMLVIKVVIR